MAPRWVARSRRVRAQTVVATDEGVGQRAIAPLLVIAASDIEVGGLHVDRVGATSIVVSGAPAPGVSGVVVRDNLVTGLGRGAGLPGIALVAGGAGGRLADVWVRGNRLLDVHVPISVVGGAANQAGERAAGNTLEGIHVTDNTAERGTGGVFVCVGAATFGGQAEDNAARDIEIARNRVVENLDVALGLSSSCLLAGGVGNRNRASEVRFRDNELFTPATFGRMNSGLFVSGAQLALGAGGSSVGDRVDGVTIEGTDADGVGGGGVRGRRLPRTLRRRVQRA